MECAYMALNRYCDICLEPFFMESQKTVLVKLNARKVDFYGTFFDKPHTKSI